MTSGLRIGDGDLDRLAGMVAEDAVLSALRADSVRGRAAIVRRLEPEPHHSGAWWVLESYWTSVCVCEDAGVTHTSVLRRLDGSRRLLHRRAEPAG